MAPLGISLFSSGLLPEMVPLGMPAVNSGVLSEMVPRTISLHSVALWFAPQNLAADRGMPSVVASLGRQEWGWQLLCSAVYQDREYTAVVTGFGPFGCHTVNASWEAVKELSKLCAASKQLKDVRVIVKEIPVSYEDVDSYIPKLWEEYSPIVVLHVGVSHKASCLTIESHAHSSGYTRPDIYQKLPIESNTDFKIFQTKLDVTKICDTVNGNSGESECKACISKDAGRYLCEYIFYRSLQIQPTRTLFIHVPDFDKYSSTRIANGLYNTLCCTIEHVKRNQE